MSNLFNAVGLHCVTEIREADYKHHCLKRRLPESFHADSILGSGPRAWPQVGLVTTSTRFLASRVYGLIECHNIWTVSESICCFVRATALSTSPFLNLERQCANNSDSVARFHGNRQSLTIILMLASLFCEKERTCKEEHQRLHITISAMFRP